MAATNTMQQPKDAASTERMRKKPRLAPSPSHGPSAGGSSSASRPKSGLMPPSINTTRVHSYAFGSRLPLSGKENTVNVNKPTAASGSSSTSKAATDVVKKSDWDSTTSTSANASLPPKSAIKRRPKRRQSQENASNESKTSAPSTPASAAKSGSTEPTQMQTPPSAVASKPASVATVVLSPIKPVVFEPVTATDPEFWKARQEFARTALLELKALEERMNLLSKTPTRA